MKELEGIILGIIQGLTEFLPVSSSGHLELAKAILNQDQLPEESLFMTVLLHAATALSTIVIFRKDIGSIFSGLFKGNKEELNFSVKIIVSMIPAAVIGVLFNDAIESLFNQQYILVGCMLLVTGVLLFVADKAEKTDQEVSTFHAVIIGISQAIAILPGISRSGATISTSVLLGIDRKKAARFSFLMVVPLILGKMTKDLLDGGIHVHSDDTMYYLLGFLAAFFSGLLACNWMIRLVQKSQLKYFSYYCFAVGITAIILTLWR